MTENFQIKSLLKEQRKFFLTNATQSIEFRITQLKKLKNLIQLHEEDILTALYNDLKKPRMEAYSQEVRLVVIEIDFIIKHLSKWAKPRKVGTPFPMLWPARSEIYFEPYGTVFIISPWNFPFMLTMSPLVGAMAAGNCVIVKPSEISTHTEYVMINLVNQHFPENYIKVLHGQAEQTQTWLQEKYDLIFYTGGLTVGKLVMQSAAKHVTPVILELGGKSPCIIDATANLEVVARRIIWGKMSNAGQTCIAPDYLLVHESCKAKLIELLKKTIREFYSHDPQKSDSYGRIINQKHFSRLTHLLKQGNILCGGENQESSLYIAPTLMDGIQWNDPIMQEEIFGPILPILSYTEINDIIHLIRERPKPLALYLFSQDKQVQEKILQQISFGSGCINDCLLQIANVNFPFGGVGESGMGRYHGKFSFESFSHQKSIYKKYWRPDFNFQYPPYFLKKFKILKRLMAHS